MNNQMSRRSFVSGIGAGLAIFSGSAFAGSLTNDQISSGSGMSKNDLRQFFMKYIEVLNAHEMDRMDEFVHERVMQNMQPVTREYVIKELYGHVEAVPDFKWRVKDLVVEGDTVAARLFNIGTPAKEWLGIAPSGRTVETLEFAFHKVRDGRFYEMNYAMDVMGLKRQLTK